MWRLLLLAIILLRIDLAFAQGLPPPIPSSFVVSSDFGPRNFYKWLHKGIDYAVPIGTPVQAVQSGTIQFITFSYDGTGWDVSILGDSPTLQFQYLHLFRDTDEFQCDLADPRGICELLPEFTDSSSGLPVTLVTPLNNGSCRAIVFWSDAQRTKPISNRVYGSSGISCKDVSILGESVKSHVNQGEIFTVSGESGAARNAKHVHLQVRKNGGHRHNPFVQVSHPNGQYPDPDVMPLFTASNSVTQDGYLKLGRDKNMLELTSTVTSTDPLGLDLNRVVFKIYQGTTPPDCSGGDEIAGSYICKVFDYGGNPGEKKTNNVCSMTTLNPKFQCPPDIDSWVEPLTNGKDKLHYKFDWYERLKTDPGTYKIQVFARSVKPERLSVSKPLLVKIAPADAFKDFPITGFNSMSAWVYGIGTTGIPFSPFSAAGDCYNGSNNLPVGLFCWNTGNNSVPAAAINLTQQTLINGNIHIEPGVVYVHPGQGANSDTIGRFLVPADGRYRITGNFQPFDKSPNGVTTLIYLNDTSLFTGGLFNGAGVNNFDLTLDLKKDDRILFGVNNNGDYTFDSTGLSATITLAPDSPNPLP